MKKEKRGILFIVLGFIGPLMTVLFFVVIFSWSMSAHDEAFSDFGRFQITQSFFLDNGQYAIGIGEKELSGDYNTYLNTYSTSTYEIVKEEQLLSVGDLMDSRNFTVLHQGTDTLLLADMYRSGTNQQELEVYTFAPDGTFTMLSGGEVFHLVGFEEFETAVWTVMENALFSAQQDGDTIIGLIQDGEIYTLNLTDDPRFASGIKAIYPGLATIIIETVDGQTFYVGQFLLDDNIPVVTESEREELYMQYVELYFGGLLITPMIDDDASPFNEPPFKDPHEILTPLGLSHNFSTWSGSGYPYGLGESAYLDANPHAYSVLPYGYTLISNTNIESEIPTVLLVDTFTGKTRVDLSGMARESRLEVNDFYDTVISKRSSIIRNTNGDDIFLLGDTIYINLTTGETKMFDITKANEVVEEKESNDTGFLHHFMNTGLWVLGIVLFGGVIIRSSIHGKRHHNRVMKKHGAKIVTATILSIARTGVYINDNPQLLLELSFLWEGEIVERELLLTMGVTSFIQVGGKIPVLYDPVKKKAYTVPNEAVDSDGPRLVSACINEIIETGYYNSRSKMVILHAKTNTGENIETSTVEWRELPYRVGDWIRLSMDGSNTMMMHRSHQNVFPPDEEMIEVQAVITDFQETGWLSPKERLVGYHLAITEPPSFMFMMGKLPEYMVLSPGTPITTNISRKYYNRLTRMRGKPQGAATVFSVEFIEDYTFGRSFKRAEIEIVGQSGAFYLDERIEEYFGLQVGDVLWVAYDIITKEALILRYPDIK